MTFGTLTNAAVVIAIVAAIVIRRLSWSELENSDTDVWRGPVVMAGYLVLRLGLAGVGHLSGATITSGGGSILLTMGANLLVQSVIVQSRAHRQAEEYAGM